MGIFNKILNSLTGNTTKSVVMTSADSQSTIDLETEAKFDEIAKGNLESRSTVTRTETVDPLNSNNKTTVIRKTTVTPIETDREETLKKIEEFAKENNIDIYGENVTIKINGEEIK